MTATHRRAANFGALNPRRPVRHPAGLPRGPLLDAAIGRAVLDFYTTGTDTIARAVAEFQASHCAATTGH